MKLTKIIAQVAILGSTLAFFATAPAYAATARPAAAKAPAATATAALPSSCTSHGAVVCIYANANYTGGPGIFSGTNADWGADFGSSDGACVAGSTAAPGNEGGWNDCVSSIVNNTSVAFIFYVNDNCLTDAPGGGAIEVRAHTDVADLSTFAIGFNDALSSDSRGATPVDC